MQELLTQVVDAVVRDQNMCIKPDVSHNPITGEHVNVMTAGFPNTFYEDHSYVKWTSALAYGSEWFGLPTGFEWHVLALE